MSLMSLKKSRWSSSIFNMILMRGKYADDVIYIPRTHWMLTSLLANIPQQLFAYYMARDLGNDVDKPRNLAKSVTVE